MTAFEERIDPFLVADGRGGRAGVTAVVAWFDDKWERPGGTRL